MFEHIWIFLQRLLIVRSITLIASSQTFTKFKTNYIPSYFTVAGQASRNHCYGMLTSSYSTRPNRGLRSSSFWAIYIIYHHQRIFTKFEAFSSKMSKTMISCLIGLIHIMPLRSFFSMKLRFLFCVNACGKNWFLESTLCGIPIHS